MEAGRAHIEFEIGRSVEVGLERDLKPLRCRSVRISTFRVRPLTFAEVMHVDLAPEGISFFAPQISDSSEIVKITLKPSEILKMLVHFGPYLPVLFVITTARSAAAIRKSLNMTVIKHDYYDPTAVNEKYKKITFLIDSINEEQQNFLRHHFVSAGKVKELDQTTANEILITSSPMPNFFVLRWDTILRMAQERGVTEGQIAASMQEVSQSHRVVKVTKGQENQNTESEGSFHKGLKDMLLDNKYSDFVINVRGKVFTVHRVILAAHSPFFAAMFEHDMKEKNTSTLHLEDCEPEIFSDFLHFLYTGEIEGLNAEKALDLYEISDKYLVSELSSLCVQCMMGDLSEENVLDLLELGLRFREKRLINGATQFFLRNAKQIASTDQWIAFLGKNPVAGNELLFLKTGSATVLEDLLARNF